MTDTKRKLIRRQERLSNFLKMLLYIFVVSVAIFICWAMYLSISMSFIAGFWWGIGTVGAYAATFGIIGSIFYLEHLKDKIDRMK